MLSCNQFESFHPIYRATEVKSHRHSIHLQLLYPKVRESIFELHVAVHGQAVKATVTFASLAPYEVGARAIHQESRISKNQAASRGLGFGGIQIFNKKDFIAVLPVDKLVNESLGK